MRFTIKTKAKSVWTMPKRRLIREFMVYANCYLGLHSWDEKVVIRLTGDKYSPGMCCDLEDHFVVKVSGNQSNYDILETLLHELVHVRQYASGQLDDLNDNTSEWMGHIYQGDFQDTESSAYWNAPWEVEAREVAEELANFYYQN